MNRRELLETSVMATFAARLASASTNKSGSEQNEAEPGSEMLLL
jgi:hypothetical protein